MISVSERVRNAQKFLFWLIFIEIRALNQTRDMIITSILSFFLAR